MKNLIRCFTLVICASSSFAFAAKGSSGGGGSEKSFGKGSVVWVGGGLGSRTVKVPEHSVDPNLNSIVTGGVEIKLFGPFAVTFGAQTTWSEGYMPYDYTDAANVHYTANRVEISTTEAGILGGLQIRLIELSWFRLFVTGGGFATGADIKYKIPYSDTSGFSSQNYQKAQSTNVVTTGTFAEAGIDFFIPNGYGLRFAGRMSKTDMSKIEALTGGKMRSEEAFGEVAFLRKF